MTSTGRRGLLGPPGGGLLVAGAPGPSPGATLRTVTTGAGTGPAPAGASRTSRVSAGTVLVSADLHNHTLLSDGDGDPDRAFASLRAAGLDVAALTDHATFCDRLAGDLAAGRLPPGYTAVAGLTPQGWARTGALADAHDEPGVFTAVRGFEWSEPVLGHVNVWCSAAYTDVVEVGRMDALHRWLVRCDGSVGPDGVDPGGLAGFNHPGREPGRFDDFRLDPVVVDRFVSLEMFNRYDDYLFEGWTDGRPSPLVACLGAGWRTGLSGVTDEHGNDWGFPADKGRTGLWVTELTRAGMLEALRARRFFATRTSGLRLDATAEVLGRAAGPVRMGGGLALERGEVRFVVDVDGGPDRLGRELLVQVLRPGAYAPLVVEVVGTASGEVVTFTVPLDAAEGGWVVLRVSDPTGVNRTPGPDGHPCNDLGVAYASPWWLGGTR